MTNFAFEDPDEGKSREMDVRAVKRVAFDEQEKITVFVELIVECKNTSNPFVFIARPENERDLRSSPKEFLFPYSYEMKKDLGGGRGMSKQVEPFVHLGFDQVYKEHQKAWKAVQFCRIDRKGSGWHANHGGLYDAMFYPMAKAVTARKSEVPKPRQSGDRRHFWFFFPLVVTSGGLMLIDTSESAPVPRPVDHVSFTRELKSGKLTGPYALTFVRQEQLQQFVEQVIDPVAALASDLVNNRLEFLKSTSLTWTE